MMRALAMSAAGAIAAAIWIEPAQSFAGHMVSHMFIVVVIAPLIALGTSGTAIDPVTRAPRAFNAIVASVVELVAVWAWHVPALHEAARHGRVMFVAEQASFLCAGWYFWASIVGGREIGRAARRGIGVVALLLTFAHMTLLGVLLAVSPRALYTHGLSDSAAAMADQQAGGIVMLVASAIAYVGAALWISHRMIAAPIERKQPCGN